MAKKPGHREQQNFAAVLGDAAHIPALLQIANDPAQLAAAQTEAKDKLWAYDHERHNACAITLSVLLQHSGIDVPDTFMAIDMGNLLRNQRQWRVIQPGQQQAGDVGSTCGAHAVHGVDHVYLVLATNGPDQMTVADNQQSQPHPRTVSAHDNVSLTQFFLRAS